MPDEPPTQITSRDARYRMSELDFYVNASDRYEKVDAMLKEWSDHGWEILSATATAYTVHGYATPYVKYVVYWRNPFHESEVRR